MNKSLFFLALLSVYSSVPVPNNHEHNDQTAVSPAIKELREILAQKHRKFQQTQLPLTETEQSIIDEPSNVPFDEQVIDEKSDVELTEEQEQMYQTFMEVVGGQVPDITKEVAIEILSEADWNVEAAFDLIDPGNVASQSSTSSEDITPSFNEDYVRPHDPIVRTIASAAEQTEEEKIQYIIENTENEMSRDQAIELLEIFGGDHRQALNSYIEAKISEANSF